MHDKRTVTVFIIATNKYVDYAINLIKSINQFFTGMDSVQIIVLTDSINDLTLPIFRDEFSLQAHQIPSYGWPEATLLRFELMLKFWNFVTGNIVMYLDADTEVVSCIEFNQLMSRCDYSLSSGVSLVLHPGYFNRKFVRRLLTRTTVGPWESRKQSTAFVPFLKRNRYVCGGVFWGLRDSFNLLCGELKSQIDLDLKRNVSAKHNDESHLNRWFVSNSTQASTPEWAFARGYHNLEGLTPRIEVIHKPLSFIRLPTVID